MARAMFRLASCSTRPSSLGRLVNAWTCNSRRPHRSPRRACEVKGSCRWSQRSAPLMARSTRGITQGGVRWRTVSFATSGWMAGTIWMAEAPVPTIATRLPRRS